MLTTKRLIELGFEYKISGTNWYLEKNKFCLFPMNGCWALGSDFGALATGVDGIIIIIETEEELNKIMK